MLWDVMHGYWLFFYKHANLKTEAAIIFNSLLHILTILKDKKAKFKVYEQIFKETSNTKFHENPSSRNRVVPCGRTDGWPDRHDKANSHFSQFCEHALKCTA
jgi:hypothetical protein